MGSIRSDLPKTLITASDEFPSLSDVLRIQVIDGEDSLRADRSLKSVVTDELGESGCALQMGFRCEVEHFGIDLSDDIPQIEGAFGDLLDFIAAYAAQIALIASSHRMRPSGEEESDELSSAVEPSSAYAKPRTLAIEYIPGGLPKRYLAAAIAPLA